MTTKILPQGKLIYIWRLHDVKDLAAMAQEIKDANFDGVAVKITDGVIDYNVVWKRDAKGNVVYENGQRVILRDLAAEFKAECEALGLAFWGWSYLYGYNIPVEGALAVKRAIALDVIGFIANCEKEWKGGGREADAAKLMNILNAGLPKLAIGFSSFRYPEKHALPWKVFLDRCDFIQSQVYWFGSNNPAWQLAESYRQFRKISSKPFVPAGWCSPEQGYAPSQRSLDEYHAAVLSMGLAATLWWEWKVAKRVGNIALIAKHLFPEKVSQPPVVSVPVSEPPASSSAPLDIPIRVLAHGLNVRSAPSLSADIVGQLKAGASVLATELRRVDQNLWGRMGLGWVAIRYNNQNLASLCG
jgi:hypothetical protein